MKSKFTDQQKDELIDLYYNQRGFQVGIKKLFELLREKEPEAKISYRYVGNWLKQQPSYQINQLTRQTKHIKPITAKRKFALVQFDLIDYSQNTAPNSYKYLLTIIDVWSRYAWLIPLKNKKSQTLVSVFEEWLNENKDELNPYRVFMSDQGGEWSKLQPLFSQFGIKYTQNSIPQSNGVVERLNQTIRRFLAKNVIIKNPNSRWGLVPMIMKNYNELYHSTIKMSPKEKFNLKNRKLIKQLDKEEKQRVKTTLKKRLKNDPISSVNEDLEVGDMVRIKKLKKNPLDKSHGYNNWSIDVYTVFRQIRALKASTQPRFEVKNKEGSILKKRFYRDDLLKITSDTTPITSELGKPKDNENVGVTEEEIVFETKPEVNTDDNQNEPNQEQNVPKAKKQKKPKTKLVVEPREKSTRVKKAPNRLDL